jgi:tripartite-type tricarboxylate transporter receptor subunit TctC
MRRRSLLLSTLAAPTTLVAPPGRPACAQAGGAAATWPARQLRLVVPYPPGGAPDAFGRRLAERLTAALGQPVLVENRTGAGGLIGMDLVAKAPPDGYLLGVGGIAPHAVGPAVHRAVPYDPLRDFAQLALLAEFPLALGASAEGPYRDFGDLLAAARRTPGGVRVGTPGTGTSAHASLELLRRLAGVELVHVPFRGTPQALPELLAGRLDATLAVTGEFAGNDRVRVLAVAAPERMAGLPAVPTFRERGVDLVTTVWFTLCAPAGLSEAVAERLHRETQTVLVEPGTAALMVRLGAVPTRGLGRAELAAFVAAEAARWGEVVRAAGIRAE